MLSYSPVKRYYQQWEVLTTTHNKLVETKIEYKSGMREYTLYDSIYIKFKNRQN